MSDIRFNRWLHQSGTGGVYQDSSGNVGIGTSVPTTALDVVGIVSAASFTGNLTGTASTATAAATAYGISGSPTLSGITSVSTTNLTVNGNRYPSAGPLSNRNLIINGAMQVAQRGTSDTGFTSSSYMADRFRINVSNMGTWDGANSSTSPSGFTNSCRFDCTTADASPAAADFVNFKQIFEGQNLQHLKYGTASAESLTLSFWVRSNKTGTYTVELDRENADFNSISYSISSADTWEYKTVTFSGLTSSAIPNDNTEGLKINWWLGGGSNYSSGTQTNNTWHTTIANRLASGQVNLADSTSNEWYITGVQLEVGTVATPFEHRSYGDELARCQRYYKQVLALQGFTSQSFFTSHYGTTNAINIIEAGLSNMRSGVNVSLGPTGNTGNVQYYSYGGAWTSSTLSVTTLGTYPHQQIYLYSTADGDGRGKLLRRSGASDPNIYVEISAEL